MPTLGQRRVASPMELKYCGVLFTSRKGEIPQELAEMVLQLACMSPWGDVAWLFTWEEAVQEHTEKIILTSP